MKKFTTILTVMLLTISLFAGGTLASDRDSTLKPLSYIDTPVTGLDVSTTDLRFNGIGSTNFLYVTVLPLNTSHNGFGWKVDNPEMISVFRAYSGLSITANMTGTTTMKVYASSGNYEKTVKITVENATGNTPITGLNLSTQNVTMKAGDEQFINVGVTPANATNNIYSYGYETSLSNEGIVYIGRSPNGIYLKADLPGEVTLTVKAVGTNITKTIKIAVVDDKGNSNIQYPVTELVVSYNDIELEIDKQCIFVVDYKPINATNKDFTLELSKEGIVTVSRNKDIVSVIGAKPGTTVMTLKTLDGSVKKTINITVKGDVQEPDEPVIPVYSFDISATRLDMEVGVTKDLTVRPLPFNATNRDYTWSLSNPEIVSVVKVSDGLLIKGLKAGQTTLTITCDNAKSQVPITVSAAPGSSEEPDTPSDETTTPDKPSSGGSSSSGGTSSSDKPSSGGATSDKGVEIYRLYNAVNGEHLYTTSQQEVQVLTTQHGWKDEGIGWIAPSSGQPVYRLNSPTLATHLYTMDENEVRELTTNHGWQQDFNGEAIFASGGNVKVYRLFDGNARIQHHLTTDENEYNVLPGQGWVQEGHSLSGIALGKGPELKSVANTPAEYAIEADVTLNGTGSGFHAKLVACTPTSAVSFGMQYDAHAVAGYTGKTAYLVENVAHNGAGGQTYTRYGITNTAETHHLMLTVQKDGTCSFYVDHELVGTEKNPSLANNSSVALRVEGSARLNGDVVNAQFNNIKIKKFGTYDPDKVWNTHKFDTAPTVHSTDNYSSNRSVSIGGTLSGLGAGQDWDSAYDQVSGIIQFY